jgi:hypothetical protein
MNPPRTKTDHFAEALAEGATVREAAKTVGWTAPQGQATLQRLRRKFGAQGA